MSVFTYPANTNVAKKELPESYSQDSRITVSSSLVLLIDNRDVPSHTPNHQAVSLSSASLSAAPPLKRDAARA
ncbi:hypothetical protein [Shewanella violacea]|uniref:hypothetical protein n=1 Tax=Shewanella violacea TaxID=60217 RepID=UPI00059DB79D